MFFYADTIFSVSNLIAMIAWLLLLFAPKWKGTEKAVLSGGVSLLFGGMYALLIGASLTQGGMDFMSFSTLEGVHSLFQVKEAVLVGWLHYLAFDLFVGLWEIKDSQKRGVPHLLVIPCLIFTFMMGPVGLLLYFLIRSFYKK